MHPRSVSHPVRNLLCIGVALSIGQPAFAASGDEIVVTATRAETRVAEVLSDITVIDRHSIERSAAASLPQLLASQHGIGITQAGGLGSTVTLSIRGTNSTHALVLIDGQRVSSATAGTTAIEHIPLAQIERIEILRGPASSLYGADAIGGVVQIFTRGSSGRSGGFASLGHGTHATSETSAGYAGSVGATRYSLQVGETHSRGFSAIKAADGSFFDSFNPDRDGYDNRSVSARISHKLTPGTEAGASVLRILSRKQFDSVNCDVNFLQCTADFDNTQDQTLTATSAYLSVRPGGIWSSKLTVGRGDDRSAATSLDPVADVVRVDHFDTTQDQLSWQNDFELPVGKTIAAIDWRDEKVDSTTDYSVKSRQTTALMLGYQARAGIHDLQLSGRIDDVERYGSYRSGSLAYGLHVLESWRVHGAIGRAFHAPTFNDLYWPVDFVNFFEGNPNLRPERAYNREIGVKYFGSAALVEVTAYRNEVSDLLNFVSPPFPALGHMENVADATLQGVSLALAYELGNWSLDASADLLDAKDDNTGRTLARRSPRSGAIALSHDGGTVKTRVEVAGHSYRYNDAANLVRLAGYATVGVAAEYRIDRDWQAQLKLDNLLDRDYVTNRIGGSDFATPGRTLFVGVRYQPE